jgi:hypothetical protein
MDNITYAIDETLKENFLKELNEDTDDEDNNRCLISYEELKCNSITLPCNHSFNYYPLYKEICNQKLKTNFKEIIKLRLNQIKCPYCRSVHNNLIPYHAQDGVEQQYGVTRPVKYVLLPNKCLHVFKSGKTKGNHCNIKCNGDYCKRHTNSNTTSIVKYDNIITNNTDKCEMILQSGKRKGSACNRTNCKYHQK